MLSYYLIGIVRALFLKPIILILDEATSALYNHTQAIVNTSLEQFALHPISVIAAEQVMQVGNFDELTARQVM